MLKITKCTGTMSYLLEYGDDVPSTLIIEVDNQIYYCLDCRTQKCHHINKLRCYELQNKGVFHVTDIPFDRVND